MNKKRFDALKIICGKLKNKEIKWVLAGSTSFALQGVKIKPKDIDILSNKGGALKINKLLKEYEIKPVRLSSSNLFKSYLGEFKIKGVKIKVTGNLKEKVGNKWVSLSKRLANPKFIKIKGIEIPVSSLKAQLASYKKGRRKKDAFRVQKIKEYLAKQKRSYV